MIREKNITIALLFLALCFSSCTGEYWQYWHYSSFKPFEHKVVPDSAYVARYGAEAAMRNGPMGDWIKDSVPYFYVSLEKQHHELFLLLVSIVHQRKREKFGLDLSIANDKNQIKSLDSVYYSITDSVTSENKAGKLIYGKDFAGKKGWGPLQYLTSNSIDLHPKKGDVIQADFEIYYTDIHNRVKVMLGKKVKFEYYRCWGYWYTFVDV